jgi:4-methoxybenzoate monooxygenase (O-demethylating)
VNMQSQEGSVPELDADPFALDNIVAPYKLQSALREAGPLVFLKRYGTYAVARDAEVRAVLQNWESFTTVYGSGLADVRDPQNWRQLSPIAEIDPPKHTHIRGVMQRIISPTRIKGWRSAFEAQAKSLAAVLAQKSDVNAVKEIVEPYVLTVFPAALGIEVGKENLIAVGNHNFNSIGPRNELFAASLAVMDSIAEWYKAAVEGQTLIPGGFGQDIFDAEAAGDLPTGEASKLLMTLLRGGVDTTISGLGTALRLLALHPGVWQTLRHDRSRVRVILDEAIRLEAPLQTYYRTTRPGAQIAGITLKPDSKIQVLLGAANRDPRRWPNPDQFDITRSGAGHVAFGFGNHACLGQMVARLEAECLLNALLDSIKTLELRGEPIYRPINTLRTLDYLPLRLSAN